MSVIFRDLPMESMTIISIVPNPVPFSEQYEKAEELQEL